MAVKKQIAIVEVMCNTKQAVQMLDEYKRLATDTLTKIETKTKELNALKAKGANATAADKKQMTALAKEIKTLTADFNKYNSATQKGIDSHRKLSQVMKDLSGAKLKDLKAALRDLNRMMGDVSNKTPMRAKVIQNAIDQVQGKINKLQGTTKGFGATHNSVWQTAVRNITAYMGVMAGFNWVKNKIDEVIEKNKEFSDQMANVRKVSGLAMEDISKLANSLSQIDSRTSLQGLMELSYTGAKLGFGNYGIEGLESFARSAVKVQNALSEDMGEESMTALSKLVEVMGLIPKMGVEKAMDAAGSAIFKLASTSTATGTNIIEFTKRLMGLANVSHVTTAELLALGSASDSMGLMAEVSATAFNKVFTSIQSNTTAIEKALKFTKGELIDLVNQGRTMDAIVAVFEKMHGMSMDQLKNQGVFKALGSDGARLNNVMITMSNRIDMLKDHLQTSNDAFKEGTAVAQEYAIQMDTAAAYSERAANIWNKAFVNPEGVDTVKEFTKAWYDVSVSMTNNKVVMGEIRFLLAGILELMKGIVSILPSILYGLTTIGGYRLGAAIATGLKPGIEAVKGMTLSLSALRTGFMVLSTAARANIVGVAVTAVFALVSAFGLLNKKIKEATGYMDGFKSDLSDLNLECAKGEAELRRYRKAIDEANVGTKQRAAAIAQFNNKFKPYLSNLLTEKSTALDVANAYNEITKAMRTKLALQLKEKDIEQQVMPREQWTAQRREEYDAAARAAGFGQYGSSWITGYAQDNAKKSVSEVVKNLGKQFYNMPQQVLDEVMKQVDTGASSFNNYGNIINSKYLKQANALLAAGNYIRQDRAATEAMNRVNKKWKPEQEAMDAMIAAQQKEEPITPIDETRPDPDELKQLKKEEMEYKQALRKDLKDAKEESDAIISKIEEWYRLQESVITGMAADGKLTQEQAEQATRTLNIAKNTALRDARLAISGRNTEAWEKTKQQIGTLMIDQGEWSKELLAQILEVSMASIRQNLARIDKGGGQFGITTSSLRDAVDKNAAGNQREIARLTNKSAIEVEKLLDQYHFVDVALKSFSNRLEQMGVLTETAEQLANRLKTGEQPKQTEQAKRNLLQAFINSGAAPYSVNPDDTASLTAWMQQFTGFGVGIKNGIASYNFNNFSEPFAGDFALWLSQPETYKSQIQAFYFALLQSSDQYYKAQRQQYEFYKKQNQQQWENSGRKDFYDQTYTGLENRQKLQDAFGTGQSFGQQYGLVDTIANDPEVELYKQKLAAAAEYYQFVESHQHTEQELREASQATLEAYMAMAQKVGDEVAERASKIQELEQPLDTFAEEVGQKWGDMLFNMESSSETWNSIVKKLILSYAQMTIKMTAENLTKKIQQALFYKQMEAMETQHQAQMLAIQTTFGMMRIGAQQTMNATGQAVKSADDAATVGKEVTLATILTQLGISEGAAKIIGKLGWWGIPLVGVISSLLLGLLSSALSTANKASSNSSNTKVKLVSGMLTYDEGNVSQYVGRSTEGRSLPAGRENADMYVGNDGNVYHAKYQPSLPEGVSLVRQPIATTVNGQPSLVAEKGPEIVIGRRTTRQIMMNEPGLLRRIAQIERGGGFYTRGGMRTLDSGNLEEVLNSSTPTQEGNPSGLDSETQAALKALPTVLAAFTQLMGNIQQKGIPAKMAAFGDGSLDEGMRTVNNFRKKYPQ